MASSKAWPHHHQLLDTVDPEVASTCQSLILRNSEEDLNELITRGKAKGLLSGDSAPFLLHAAAQQGADYSISVLVKKGWEVDRRVQWRPHGVPPRRGLMPEGEIDYRQDPSRYEGVEFPSVEAGVVEDLGTTPLEEAILCRQFRSVITLLHYHNADPKDIVLERFMRDLSHCEKRHTIMMDMNCRILMWVAIRRRSWSTLRVMFGKGNANLFWAFRGALPTFQQLIRHRDFPREMFSFVLPYFVGNISIGPSMQSLLNSWHGHGLLREALMCAKPSDYELSFMMTWAVEEGCIYTIDILLELWPETDINIQMAVTVPSLLQAARSLKQGSDSLRFLLSRGADPCLVAEREEEAVGTYFSRFAADRCLSNGVRDATFCYIAKGDTPLHIVAKAPGLPADVRRQRAQMLLDAGADPNAQNAVGHTPLHSDVLRSIYIHQDWMHQEWLDGTHSSLPWRVEDRHCVIQGEADQEFLEAFEKVEAAREQTDTTQTASLCTLLSEHLTAKFHEKSIAPLLEAAGADKAIKDIRGRDRDQFLSERRADTIIYGRSMPAALIEMDLREMTLDKADAHHLDIHLHGPLQETELDQRRYNGPSESPSGSLNRPRSL